MTPASRVALLGLVLACACAKAKNDSSQSPADTADCDKARFEGAEAEVGRDRIALDLPAVPSFELPPVNADGSHAVKEMRVQGASYLGQEIEVTGYVTWVYDCATAIRTPEMSAEDAARLIADDPSRCSRPKFRIGDAPGARDDHSIAVVEVPRYPTALEKKVLGDEIKDTSLWRPVPPLVVGDEVVVTGDWTQRAPHGDSNRDGLLVYRTMTNVTQSWPP